MEDATIGFEGPFTADDVPSYILVEVKLAHAMMRDKYGIQSMFNHGNGRFYGSNIDFSNKSYYRNRNGSGKGKYVDPKKVTDSIIGAVIGPKKTANYVAGRYQSLRTAVKTA